MQWTYKGKQIDELPEGCEAFVYLITNKVNGMMYVGKKLAKFKVTKKPLKGKKIKGVALKKVIGKPITVPVTDLMQTF